MTEKEYNFDLEKVCEHLNLYNEGKEITLQTLEIWADEGLFEYKIKNGSYKININDIKKIAEYKKMIIDQDKTIKQAKQEFDGILEKKEKELNRKFLDFKLIEENEESLLITKIKEMNSLQAISLIKIEEKITEKIEEMKKELSETTEYYQIELNKKQRELEKKEIELMYEKKFRIETKEELERYKNMSVWKFAFKKKKKKKKK